MRLALCLLISAAIWAQGPEIGQKIPSIELQDQSGAVRNFDSLKGRKGLVLLFVRSADW